MALEPKGNYQAIDRKEHDKDSVAKRVIQVDPFGGIITEGNYTQFIDEASATVTYIGLAQIGAATSEAGFQIKKIVVSGNVTSITWADSTDAFTKVWDDRATYTYA